MLSAIVLEIINERLISKQNKTSNSNTRFQNAAHTKISLDEHLVTKYKGLRFNKSAAPQAEFLRV